MQSKAIIQSLAAVLLWSTLAALALQLARMPPFLLVGSALLIGSLCSIDRISQWRVPSSTLLLGVYGLFGFHLSTLVLIATGHGVFTMISAIAMPLTIGGAALGSVVERRILPDDTPAADEPTR